MQVGQFGYTSPIAPIKRILANKIQRASYHLAILASHDQQNLISKAGSNFGKKFTGQIGSAPFFINSRQVKTIEIIPMFGPNIGTCQLMERYPLCLYRLAFFANIFAFA